MQDGTVFDPRNPVGPIGPPGIMEGSKLSILPGESEPTLTPYTHPIDYTTNDPEDSGEDHRQDRLKEIQSSLLLLEHDLSTHESRKASLGPVEYLNLDGLALYQSLQDHIIVCLTGIIALLKEKNELEDNK